MIDLVTANELDLLGQVILFFANELDLFIKIKEMVILNNPETESRCSGPVTGFGV